MITQTLKEREVDIATAAARLEIMTDAGDNVFLWGQPGIGKTDVVHQLGAKKKRKVMIFHVNLRESVDLRGAPRLDGEWTRWLPPYELPQVERDGEAGYFFLDEWNTGRPEVMAATFSLAQDGVIGEYRLPPQWRVIGAGNRVIDRAAAQRMPTPLRNKLSHLFVKVDVDAWVTWAKANNVPPEIIAFIKWRPTLLHIMPAGDENAFPTPRSITRASKYVTAPKEHRQALFAASIGDDVAGEMDGFVRLYESLGDIDDIIAHPDIAKLPEEADIRYAVSVALARKATRQNFSRIVTYADRLPRESKMLIMHEATVLKPDLKNTSAYSEWTLDNKDLILQAS